jgi:hypothetical protein
MMLSYFHNEGINSSAIFGQLASIADQVLCSSWTLEFVLYTMFMEGAR